MLRIKIAVAFLVCWLCSAAHAKMHPFRVVLEDHGTHCCSRWSPLTPSHLSTVDGTNGCNEEEVKTIEQLFSPERSRELVLGSSDVPCDDKCEGFPPNYCFMLFCFHKHQFGRRLRKHQTKSKDLDQVNLRDCFDELLFINDHMNSLFLEQSISNECKLSIVGARHFSCYQYADDQK